jgi:hypothetical protein
MDEGEAPPPWPSAAGLSKFALRSRTVPYVRPEPEPYDWLGVGVQIAAASRPTIAPTHPNARRPDNALQGDRGPCMHWRVTAYEKRQLTFSGREGLKVPARLPAPAPALRPPASHKRIPGAPPAGCAHQRPHGRHPGHRVHLDADQGPLG